MGLEQLQTCLLCCYLQLDSQLSLLLFAAVAIAVTSTSAATFREGVTASSFAAKAFLVPPDF